MSPAIVSGTIEKRGSRNGKTVSGLVLTIGMLTGRAGADWVDVRLVDRFPIV